MPQSPWSRPTRVIIETSSWLHPATEEFVTSTLLPVLSSNSALPVIVPSSTMRELYETSQNGSDSRASQAQQALRFIGRSPEFEVKGRDAASPSSTVLTRLIPGLLGKVQVILFTHDPSLARTLLRDARAKPHASHRLHVVRLHDRGPLRYVFEPAGNRVRCLPERRLFPLPPIAGPDRRRKVAALDLTPVARTNELGPGSTVRDRHGKTYLLGKELGRGGEGSVFEIERDLVAKIYAPNKLLRYMVDKLRWMCDHPVVHRGICWPRELLYDASGTPVGYLMPRAGGKDLRRSIFVKPILERRHPQWRRRHQVRLCLSILEIIDVLHRHDVVVGDLNGGNVLYEDENTVYFVDCDSYQVDRYPCPVGMPPFLAPELLNRNLRGTLRSKTSDHFAVATLLFMILLPGKPPYSHQGGGDPARNVRKKHFPYALGERASEGVPLGCWRFVWSHFPRYLKEAFFGVFDQDQRLSPAEWIELMQRYERDLGKGYVSDALFPRTLKQLTREQADEYGLPWANCARCNRGFSPGKPHHTLCRSCYRDRVRRRS
ncbi:MAG: hypothetical protein D6776_03425 [Planctomycetota bacterium]|nr:MAG: hypothetical protein D6776_03425 [Planctomycetota bacterium]